VVRRVGKAKRAHVLVPSAIIANVMRQQAMRWTCRAAHKDGGHASLCPPYKKRDCR